MKNRLFSYFSLLIFCLSMSFQISGQNEKTDAGQKMLSEATNAVRTGDKLISEGNIKYQLALGHYLRADSLNPSDALVKYKIGICYLNTTIQKFKSISYFEKSYRLDPNVKEDILFQLGQAYQLNYEFNKAISSYNAYKLTLKATYFDKIIDKKIDECYYAIEMIKHPADVSLENIGNVVNSKYPDYSPIINAKETMMIFTSRRPNTTGGNISPFDNKYYEDIYITHYNIESNKWTPPVNPKPPLNTNLHDAAIGLSNDGKTLLTYKASNGGDIYESLLDTAGNFSKPVRMPSPINSPAHESSACFSPDGRTIYFCSNREENSYGGHDIFYSHMDSKGKWGPAVNPGKTINTPYDEKGVFMMADGKTLYFSSNGHKTMGGFDIFKTVYQNGQWSEPVNLGYPINTPDDEIHFSISADGLHGYYASARPEGYGDLDIYRINFLGAEKPLHNTYESVIASTYDLPDIVRNDVPDKDIGYIYDDATMLPVKAKIYFRNLESNSIADSISSDPQTGSYFTNLPAGYDYGISVEAPGYDKYTETISNEKKLNKIIYIIKSPEKPQFTEEGYIYDIESNLPVCNAKIIIEDVQYLTLKDTLESDCKTGLYHSDLPKGETYELSVSAKNYMNYSETVSPDGEINKIIYLLKAKKEE
jgi:hypothetical protein